MSISMLDKAGHAINRQRIMIVSAGIARTLLTALRWAALLLLIALPVVVGFSAGVGYAVLRIIWSALAESFSAGRRSISG